MSHSGNKYHRPVFCLEQYEDTRIDVYRVLDAFGVQNPGIQHAIKKLLCSGLRGKGDTLQDLEEAKDAITEAIKIQRRFEGKPGIEKEEILFAGKEALEGLEKRRQENEQGIKQEEKDKYTFTCQPGKTTIDPQDKVEINFQERTLTVYKANGGRCQRDVFPST